MAIREVPEYFRHLFTCTRFIFSLLLIFALVFSASMLTSCKYTEVLTQHIEDEERGILDEQAEPIYRDVAGAPEDPTRTSSQISDSERIDDQINDLPDYGDDMQLEETKQREQEEDSANEQNATEGEETSEEEGSNEEAGDNTVPSESESGTNEGAGAGTSETETPEEGEEGVGDNPTGGIGGVTEVFDDDGRYDELPHVDKIAACGQHASVVQMLAGGNALVATDENWSSYVRSHGLFPGEGATNAAIAWTGDERSGYTANIDALIEAQPDVVLADGMSVSFSGSEVAALAEAGIEVITVPALGHADNPDANILSTVGMLGYMLSESNTQFDAVAMANNYKMFHDDTLSQCLQSNGGYSYKLIHGNAFQFIYQGTENTGMPTSNLSENRWNTAYIDDWIFDVNPSSTAVRVYQNASLYLDGETIDASDGAGVSAVTKSQNFLLMDFYLQHSGVANNSYEGAKPRASASSGTTYLVVPGSTTNLVTSTTKALSRYSPSALWFSPNKLSLTNAWLTVGDEAFPTVLTRSDELMDRVVTSGSKQNGLYNVGQPYKVRVVPNGLCGSWSDGGVESFLLAPWAYCVFQAGGNMSTAQQYVSQFYEAFYRTSATSGALENFDTVKIAVCPR